MVSASPVAFVARDDGPPTARRASSSASTTRPTGPAGQVNTEVTRLGPLYLQHKGHSRTIIGVERLSDGELVLVLLDPAWSRLNVERNLALGSTRSFCARASAFKHTQYQLLFVDGVYTTAEEQHAATTITSMRA